MSGTELRLDRLQVSLSGVSAEIAERAVDGLEAELRRRLGGVSSSELPWSDQAQLSLGTVHVKGRIDAAALRALIAERLVANLRRGGD